MFRFWLFDKYAILGLMIYNHFKFHIFWIMSLFVIYSSLYSVNRAIGIMASVFGNGPQD